MELRDIQTFLYIAETGKMNIAAQIMHYSQPTLTARINKLEDELGVKLFKRTPRSTTLTKYGKSLYPYAAEINRLVENATREIDTLKNENKQKLSIAASFFASCYELPGIVMKFKQKYPQVYLDIRTMKGRDVVKQVETGEVALGICRRHTTGSDMNQVLICHEPIQLCVLPTDPLLCQKEIFINDLTKLPMLGNSIDGYWKVVEECFEDAGLEMNVTMTLDNVETIKQFILRGNGISFLPLSAVKHEVAMGMIKTRPVADMVIKHEVYVYSQAVEQLDPCAVDFLNIITEK